MKAIGITGGIGAGKSVVCSILRTFDIPIYSSDEEAKKMYGREDLRQRLEERFGRDIYIGGKIDAVRLSKLIFRNKEHLVFVNSLIHPQVAEDFLLWKKKHSSEKLVAMESAILFESGFDRYVDYTLTVFSPLELRMERVMKRDLTDRERILERMKRQMGEEERIENSDFVLFNDGLQPLLPQLEKILSCIIGTV